jgi:hypothetical protein
MRSGILARVWPGRIFPANRRNRRSRLALRRRPRLTNRRRELRAILGSPGTLALSSARDWTARNSRSGHWRCPAARSLTCVGRMASKAHPGVMGGDGGDGAPGKPDAMDSLGFCKSGPGDGGDGGPGGRAGDGGPGGDGGAGGKFTLYSPEPVLDSLAASMSVNLDGGSPGAGGVPGVPGAGGAGGPRGGGLDVGACDRAWSHQRWGLLSPSLLLY